MTDTPKPEAGADLARAIERLRRAASIPIPTDDSDFDIELVRRGITKWAEIAAATVAAYDAALSPALEGDTSPHPGWDRLPLVEQLRARAKFIIGCGAAHATAKLLSDYDAALTEANALEGREPVAWRHRQLHPHNAGPITGWRYSEQRPLLSVGHSWEIQPLYAAPTPQPARAEREALKSIAAQPLANDLDTNETLRVRLDRAIEVARLALRPQPAPVQDGRTPEETFALATRLAADVGYELVPEPPHPDCPHIREPVVKIAAFLKDRDEALGEGPEHTDDEREESARCILALFSPAPSEGVVERENWVMVPKEPTQEIVDRMTASVSLDGLPSPDAEPDDDYADDMRRAYRAAIDAALTSTHMKGEG